MTEFAWYRRLPIQLLAIMVVALFPLSYAAITQSNRVVAEADQNAEIALLALTERAARSEQLLIEQAIGAAKLLAVLAPKLLAETPQCAPFLSRFVQQNDAYSFIGILPISGLLECSSSRQTIEFSVFPDFLPAMQSQQSSIVINESAPASGQSVFIVSEPYEIEGDFAGLISVSVPHSRLPDELPELDDRALIELITFNDTGTVLTARISFENATAELPSDRALGTLVGAGNTAFAAMNQSGVERRYTVIPIAGSQAGVMGIWDTGTDSQLKTPNTLNPAFFAVFMWFASMGVAMLAMYTLVLRHIYKMRRDITAFSTRRQIAPADDDTAMPAELQSLNEHFQQMATDVLYDEKLLEETVREKEVLVKEIHHRVKNNLQLISSIMNMHIRTAKASETRAVLKRIQNRVLSLATIHRNLYQSQDAGRISVGQLVGEVVERTVEVAVVSEDPVSMDVQIDDILLYPDQAVPLSLLVAEAVTNALKYVGSTDTKPPWMKIRLQQENDHCTFTIANSVGTALDAESTGLGQQLMHAFALQLNASVETQARSQSYKLILRFSAQEFVPERRDF